MNLTVQKTFFKHLYPDLSMELHDRDIRENNIFFLART